MAEKKFLTESDIREAKLDARLARLAAAGDWDKVMVELDRFDANNERRHKTHRDGTGLTLLDRKAKEGEYFCGNLLLKLCRATDWIDIIFSQDPEDLHHLVEDEVISAALRELTPVQKKVLLDNIVHRFPTENLAKEMGCSTRNITKHRQKALDAIRRSIGIKKQVRTALQFGLKVDIMIT